MSRSSTELRVAAGAQPDGWMNSAKFRRAIQCKNCGTAVSWSERGKT
jgi:hypothetical protein